MSIISILKQYKNNDVFQTMQILNFASLESVGMCFDKIVVTNFLEEFKYDQLAVLYIKGALYIMVKTVKI